MIWIEVDVGWSSETSKVDDKRQERLPVCGPTIPVEEEGDDRRQG